jgi:hypothetical protein
MAENFVVLLHPRNGARSDLLTRFRALSSVVDAQVVTKPRRRSDQFNRFNSRI